MFYQICTNKPTWTQVKSFLCRLLMIAAVPVVWLILMSCRLILNRNRIEFPLFSCGCFGNNEDSFLLQFVYIDDVLFWKQELVIVTQFLLASKIIGRQQVFILFESVAKICLLFAITEAICVRQINFYLRNDLIWSLEMESNQCWSGQTA